MKRADSATRRGKPSVYIYLLLGTRLDMKDNRVHADMDGTALLEEMSAAILETYLGSGDSRTYIIGTSNRGATFRDKVDTLCNKFGEGARFRNLHAGSVRARDAELDIVGWIPFEAPGQLIVFGQCKTGTD